MLLFYIVGQELIAKYIELLLKCEGPDGKDELMKLVRWKDGRDLFWDGETMQVQKVIETEEYEMKEITLEEGAAIPESEEAFYGEGDTDSQKRVSVYVEGDIF